jgi:hypothetical protein
MSQSGDRSAIVAPDEQHPAPVPAKERDHSRQDSSGVGRETRSSASSATAEIQPAPGLQV